MMANTKFRMLWLDMEMTGLDVEKEVPIEIAAVVTDYKLERIDDYHTVIKQPQSYLDAMDDWNRKQHGGSGLTALVPSGREPATVDQELSALIRKHFGRERAILCGNSIGQDRLFVRKYFPLTEAALHYRMIDVSSFKVVFNELYDLKYTKKKDGHRALGDIDESLAEFRFYLNYLHI